jgi:glycosyltransferase involved in cell wall biosynthesis
MCDTVKTETEAVPKISIVTISFNQASFLERAIRSVVEQDYPHVEYIVVDSGSTDGSREIIESYRQKIAKIIFEPDHGPADGLNRGFSYATGDVYSFLNSDDMLLPHTLSRVARFFELNENVDVVSGHSIIVNEDDIALRKSYSNRFSLRRYAYGASVLMQPSTFFRSDVFKRVKGFNAENCSNWDAELFVEMAYQGARFAVANELWSAYRLHAGSITTSRRLDREIHVFSSSVFKRIVGRDMRRSDAILKASYRVMKWIEDPRAFYERLTKGPIYGRKLSGGNNKC